MSGGFECLAAGIYIVESHCYVDVDTVFFCNLHPSLVRNCWNIKADAPCSVETTTAALKATSASLKDRPKGPNHIHGKSLSSMLYLISR